MLWRLTNQKSCKACDFGERQHFPFLLASRIKVHCSCAKVGHRKDGLYPQAATRCTGVLDAMNVSLPLCWVSHVLSPTGFITPCITLAIATDGIEGQRNLSMRL